MSKKQPWPGYTGWGPALLIAGGSLFVSVFYLGLGNVLPLSTLEVAIYALASFVLLATGAVLVYQAQRAWVSQEGPDGAG